jgi:hypothetical protein
VFTPTAIKEILVLTRKLIIVAWLTALILTGCISAPLATQATITLDPNVRYQTMQGWEATDQAGQIACEPKDFVPFGNFVACQAFINYHNQLFDLIVNDLGINQLEVGISQGIEHNVDYFAQHLAGQINERQWIHEHGAQPVNDNDDPFVINPNAFFFTSLDHTIEMVALPIKRRVEARGEKLNLYISFVGFHEVPGNFKHWENPEEYAEMVLAVYQHLESKYGFVPDMWEVELEPDNTSFNGTAMGLAMQATIARLEAHGYTPRFIVPSTASMSDAVLYFNAIRGVIGDAGVRKYIRQLSYHRYEDVNDVALRWIGDTGLSYGIGGAMLEHIGSGHEDLYKDLTIGNNVAWTRFTMAQPYFWGTTDRGGAYYLADDRDPNNPRISLAGGTGFLRQYFKFIRAGAVRIQANASDGNFGPVAFINRDGKYVVVVKANNGGPLTIQGLPAGTYGIKYTTVNEYDVDRPDVTIRSGEAVNTTLPATGVITIYAKASSGTSAPVTPTPRPTATGSLPPPRVLRVCACVDK